MSTVEAISGELNALLAEGETAELFAPRREPPPELEPGLYADLEMSEYLALPYLSASGLEKLRRSPKQYLHSLTAPREPSSVLERGTALHLAVLEPDLFEGHYVVIGRCEGVKKDRDRCNNNGSVYRAGQSFCGTHDPQRGQPADAIEVISQKDHDDVLGMRDAIMGHARARTLFVGNGAFESSIVFDSDGVRCRVRPDRLIERAGMYVSVKTTRSAAPWEFPKDAEHRGHFRSMALYRRGLRSAGWPYASTTVLAVESAAPYDLVCYLVDEREIDSAEEEVSRLLRLYRDCEDNDSWPGYNDNFADLSRPAWAKEVHD